MNIIKECEFLELLLVCTLANSFFTNCHQIFTKSLGGHSCQDCMAVGFTTTCAINAYHHCEFELRTCHFG